MADDHRLLSLPALILLNADPDCPRCLGAGMVCEAHPSRSWETGATSDCWCGAAGQPCTCTGMAPGQPNG